MQPSLRLFSVLSETSVREEPVEDSECWSWYSGIWIVTMHLFIKVLVSLWLA